MALAFDRDLIKAIGDVAERYGIEHAAMMAVAEIESGGHAFEQDGRTPQLLFERHVFYRELTHRAPGRRATAEAQGLAIPKWSKATQYRDEGSSSGRLALLARARAIDVESANRSCSWGLGQTMGFLAEELGFTSATSMVQKITAGGIPAQIEVMAREIKNKHSIDKLNKHQWAAFALVYNGAGYRQNQYDVKLAAAYSRWRKQLGTQAAPIADLPVAPEPLGDPPTRNADPPAPLAASPIQQGAAVGGTLSIAGVAATVWEKINEANETILNTLGTLATKPSFWIALTVVGAFAYVMWRRYRMRQNLGV